MARAFLFNWNPKRWTWENLDENIASCLNEGSLDDHWSSGNRKDIPKGSRVFLIRLGVKPKGIIGIATTLAEPKYSKGHWDPARDERGIRSLGVRLRFHLLQREPLIDLEYLQIRAPFASVRWDNESSGVELPLPVSDALEGLLAGKPVRIPRVGAAIDEVHQAPGLPEGATHTVQINAYERNPVAREACLAHHGYRCGGCDLLMEDIYGDAAKYFVHVHHVVPLSMIKRRYQVNPTKDLVPLCPNCHAVVHLFVPTLAVRQLRTLIARQRRSRPTRRRTRRVPRGLRPAD